MTFNVLIKCMGVALVTYHIMNACQENVVLATEGTPNSSNKTKHFSYKVEWAFKCIVVHLRPAFSYTVIIFA